MSENKCPNLCCGNMQRIAELEAQIVILTEAKNDAIDHSEEAHRENTALREQLARMPVVVGYVNDAQLNRLLTPYNKLKTVSVETKPDDHWRHPIYIDPQEEPNGSTEAACRKCYGTGKLYTPYKEDNEPTFICPDCKGKKTIAVPSQEPKGCLI